ncbi:MAG: glycosyltransferase family 2 protein [Pseudomonadota bacterium]
MPERALREGAGNQEMAAPLWLGGARRVAGVVRRAPKNAFRTAKGAWLQHRVERGWPRARPTVAAHGLPAPLIVSLTSFPPRFATLAPTLKCLLSQTIGADAVVLWIAHDDAGRLPVEVKRLVAHGLAIRMCDDTRSFKKIIPALDAYPDAFIVTADDDVFYPSDWLEGFVRAYDPTRREIICRRAHMIRMRADGVPLPYRAWTYDVAEELASPLLFPTGVGGVLFPPHALNADARDRAAFTRLCPNADDIWLYWMARRAGCNVRRIGARRAMITWPRSQGFSLQASNATWGGANDAQIANMIAHYGFPAAL